MHLFLPLRHASLEVLRISSQVLEATSFHQRWRCRFPRPRWEEEQMFLVRFDWLIWKKRQYDEQYITLHFLDIWITFWLEVLSFQSFSAGKQKTTHSIFAAIGFCRTSMADQSTCAAEGWSYIARNKLNFTFDLVMCGGQLGERAFWSDLQNNRHMPTIGVSSWVDSWSALECMRMTCKRAICYLWSHGWKLGIERSLDHRS